ncbi:hypothetical protein AVEN_18499-1, partial [Araneus ventricosus]
MKWIPMWVSQSRGLSEGLKKWLFKIGRKDRKTHWKLDTLLDLCPTSASRDAW